MLTLGSVFPSRQPWSAYAVHLVTLSPPAVLGDLLLLLLCHKATVSWGEEWHTWAMEALGLWMFISKFIKLLGHYIRYPVDVLLLPVSILFGYFHGIIKIYAVLTLNVVSFNLLFIIIFSAFLRTKCRLRRHLASGAVAFMGGWSSPSICLGCLVHSDPGLPLPNDDTY